MSDDLAQTEGLSHQNSTNHASRVGACQIADPNSPNGHVDNAEVPTLRLSNINTGSLNF